MRRPNSILELVRDAGAQRLLALAGLALFAFFALYVLAVQTEFGQRADEAALVGGRGAPDEADDAADNLLKLVSVGSLAATTAVLSGLAWLRRRPGLVLIPAAVIGISLLATEAFKLVILSRPDLGVQTDLEQNSFPSGHATIAVGIALAAVLISPPRLRWPVALGAVALAGLGGVFVVTANWHRPSDPIASFLLTLAVAALSVAALRIWHVWREGEPEPHHREGTAAGAHFAARLELLALMAGAALFVGSLVVASLRYGADVEWNRFHLAFLLASGAIVFAAGLTVGALLRALRRPAGPPPGRPDRLSERLPREPRVPVTSDLG